MFTDKYRDEIAVDTYYVGKYIAIILRCQATESALTVNQLRVGNPQIDDYTGRLTVRAHGGLKYNILIIARVNAERFGERVEGGCPCRGIINIIFLFRHRARLVIFCLYTVRN